MTGVLSYLKGLLSTDHFRCTDLNFKGKLTYVLFNKHLLQLLAEHTPLSYTYNKKYYLFQFLFFVEILNKTISLNARATQYFDAHHLLTL
jgi:hypothetical protein